VRVVTEPGADYFPFINFHFPSAICRIYLALFRVISWIVRWFEKGKAIREITRTEHETQWQMKNGR
jgi:hypothetical protein